MACSPSNIARPNTFASEHDRFSSGLSRNHAYFQAKINDVLSEIFYHYKKISRVLNARPSKASIDFMHLSAKVKIITKFE